MRCASRSAHICGRPGPSLRDDLGHRRLRCQWRRPPAIRHLLPRRPLRRRRQRRLGLLQETGFRPSALRRAGAAATAFPCLPHDAWLADTDTRRPRARTTTVEAVRPASRPPLAEPPHGEPGTLPLANRRRLRTMPPPGRLSLHDLMATIAPNQSDRHPLTGSSGVWKPDLARGLAQRIQYTAGSGPPQPL
jgi:hypothetical protein